jgi:hypothetical protein
MGGMPAGTGATMGSGMPSNSAPTARTYTLADKVEFLRLNAPAISAARNGFGKQYLAPFVRHMGEPGEELSANYFHSKFRWLARLFELQAATDSAQGRWNECVTAALDAVELGVTMEQHAPTTDRLSGIACQMRGRYRIWSAIDHLTSAQARTAVARMQRILAETPPFSDTVEVTKWASLASLRDAMKSRGWRSNWASNYREDNFGAYFSTLRYTKGKVLTDAADFMDREIESAKRPYYDYPSETAYDGGSLTGDPVSAMYVPACQGVHFRDTVNETGNRLLLTALALRAYYADVGNYPRWLTMLSPAYLPAPNFPANDPFGSGSLGYQLTASGYLLYSVGPDRADNLGNPISSNSRPAQSMENIQTDSRGDIVAGVTKI